MKKILLLLLLALVLVFAVVGCSKSPKEDVIYGVSDETEQVTEIEETTLSTTEEVVLDLKAEAIKQAEEAVVDVEIAESVQRVIDENFLNLEYPQKVGNDLLNLEVNFINSHLIVALEFMGEQFLEVLTPDMVRQGDLGPYAEAVNGENADLLFYLLKQNTSVSDSIFDVNGIEFYIGGYVEDAYFSELFEGRQYYRLKDLSNYSETRPLVVFDYTKSQNFTPDYISELDIFRKYETLTDEEKSLYVPVKFVHDVADGNSTNMFNDKNKDFSIEKTDIEIRIDGKLLIESHSIDDFKTDYTSIEEFFKDALIMSTNVW